MALGDFVESSTLSVGLKRFLGRLRCSYGELSCMSWWRQSWYLLVHCALFQLALVGPAPSSALFEIALRPGFVPVAFSPA